MLKLNGKKGMNGTIISGFPWIRKTTMSKKYPNEVIDMESSNYK